MYCYFCVCDAVVNEIVFSILFLNCSLLVYSVLSDFLILILYSPILLNLFTLFYLWILYNILYTKSYDLQNKMVLLLLSKSESPLFDLLVCLSWIKFSTLNISCESRYLCIVSYFRGSEFSFSLLRMLLAIKVFYRCPSKGSRSFMYS